MEEYSVREENKLCLGIFQGLLRPPPGHSAMMILLKIGIVLFLAGWSWLGLWMLLKYDQLFGLHSDDPAESSGARALNVTQVSAVWVGVFAMAVYFLIR